MNSVEDVKRIVDRVYPELIQTHGFIDSLGLVELVMAVEDELDVDIDDYNMAMNEYNENTPQDKIPELLHRAIR